MNHNLNTYCNFRNSKMEFIVMNYHTSIIGNYIYKKTVREMYEEKYQLLLSRLKDGSSDPDYLSHFFGSNFNSYSYSIRGYERKLISECNKKICKLLREYEKTLSKEDLKVLRSIYYPLIYEYIKNEKTEDFESFFIRNLINFDIVPASSRNYANL